MDVREKELQEKRICRFCMTQEEPLTNIHSPESRVNAKVSLPVQILACTSIEVFSNDTMPTTICGSCRLLMDYCYRFKQNCKTSDTKLKQYPLTGVWPTPLDTLNIPNEMFWPSKDTKLKRHTAKTPQQAQFNKTTTQAKQILKREVNTSVANEQTRNRNVQNIINKKPNILRVKDDTTETVYEISETGEPEMKRLKLTGTAKTKLKEATTTDCETAQATSRILKREGSPLKQQKKILNNNPRILNNCVAKTKKQQQYLSEPIITTDEMGNVEIVTELIEKNEDENKTDDPVKYAAPVETNVFPCNQCERTFPLEQLLKLHAANHRRERSFQCGVCSKKFYSKYDLGKHVSIHTGEKPYQCVVCKKRFSRSTLLFRHEKVHSDQPKFLCDNCDRAFLSLDELNKHAETHRKFRPFQCEECSKSFAFKQGLERHKVVHGTDQPYPCEYCDKSFMTSGKLARHLTAHAGERPFPCKLCPKSFLLSHHLTRHLRSHSLGELMYKCADCSIEFKTHDELIYHSAVHATQNMICPLCKEQFAKLDDVTEHIKLHATGEQYPCDYCDLIFPVLDKLESHCYDEHREDHRGNEHINLTDSDHNQNKSSSMEYDDEDDDAEEITGIVSNNGKVLDEIVAPKSEIYGYSQTQNSKKAPKILNKIENIEDMKDDNVEVLAEFEIRRSARPNIQKNYARMIKTEISDVEDNQDEDAESKDEEFAMDMDDDPDDENYEPGPEEIIIEESVSPVNKVLKSSTQEKITKFLQYSGKSSQPKLNNDRVAVIEGKSSMKSNEIQKVLNNLPRGVTVFKKETKEIDMNLKNSDTFEKTPTKILNTKVTSKTPPTKEIPVKEIKSAPQAKPPPSKPQPTKAQPSKSQPTKSPPTKSPPTKSPPIKAPAKYPSKQIVTTLQSRNQPTFSKCKPSETSLSESAQGSIKPGKAQPLATSTPQQQTSDTAIKYCEMKIGDRMVKVQKVRMTKTQVDAMKKEGKIEMKDGAIILKNSASARLPDDRITPKMVPQKKSSLGSNSSGTNSPDKSQIKTN